MKIWMDAYDYVSTNTTVKGQAEKIEILRLHFDERALKSLRKYCLTEAQKQLSKTVRNWVGRQTCHVGL